MLALIKHSPKSAAFVAGALCTLFVGTVHNATAAERSACRNLPVIKNLTGLKSRTECDTGVPQPHQLTRNAVKKLTATAKSPEDHLRLAQYYTAKADTLDAEAAVYEEAAASLRHGPVVKNLMAPTTPARYSFSAQRFRAEAKANRALAESQEEMAKTPTASL